MPKVGTFWSLQGVWGSDRPIEKIEARFPRWDDVHSRIGATFRVWDARRSDEQPVVMDGWQRVKDDTAVAEAISGRVGVFDHAYLAVCRMIDGKARVIDDSGDNRWFVRSLAEFIGKTLKIRFGDIDWWGVNDGVNGLSMIQIRNISASGKRNLAEQENVGASRTAAGDFVARIFINRGGVACSPEPAPTRTWPSAFAGIRSSYGTTEFWWRREDWRDQVGEGDVVQVRLDKATDPKDAGGLGLSVSEAIRNLHDLAATDADIVFQPNEADTGSQWAEVIAKVSKSRAQTT